jgi:hypothetical protein
VQPLRHGLSDRKPFPREVHRTHLEFLGYTPPKFNRSIRSASQQGDVMLRPHQLETIDFVRGRRGTLLASEQRTGKTPAVMYAFEPERGPMIVVGPLAARSVWHEWAARRFGACVAQYEVDTPPCPICERVGARVEDRPSFLSLEGRTYKPELVGKYQPHVMFLTFAVVQTWRELSLSLLAQSQIKQLGMFVIDEAHLGGMQNRKSLTVESIRWLNSITCRMVCATGTPLFNKTQGLWPLLDICAPTAFGDYWTFARRYCDAKPTEHGWKADGSSNERELKLRLSEIMFRKRWTDIQEDLPPITRTVESVSLSQREKDDIDELAARLRFQTGGAKTAVGVLARLRRLFAEAKLKYGISTVRSTILDGHSCIAWAWHTDVAERLAEKLRTQGVSVSGPITGKVTGNDRERILTEARERAEKGPHVLVANIAALGFAVNLNWASHEVFVELDWSPPNIAQAEMRPFDGTNKVSAVYLVADCDVDESLVEALLSKLENQDSLGLRAGVGDVSDVLSRTFKISGQTLDDLAGALMANAEGEVV